MSHLYDSCISNGQILINRYFIVNRAIRKCDKQYDYNNLLFIFVGYWTNQIGSNELTSKKWPFVAENRRVVFKKQNYQKSKICAHYKRFCYKNLPNEMIMIRPILNRRKRKTLYLGWLRSKLHCLTELMKITSKH